MNILIPLISSLIIFVPIAITIISFVVYDNTGNKKKLLLFTLPNFMLAAIIVIMLSFFATYGNSYVYALEAFLNGISNGKTYMWVLLIFIVLQTVITCKNALGIVEEMLIKNSNETTKNKIFKPKRSIIIIVLCVALIVISMLVIDICILKNGGQPIFSIRSVAYSDGGTKEYLGFGYKIIDYNKIDGYDGYKIGTWFMFYDNSL